MTEKRFTLNDLDNIQDNNLKGRLYILTERGGVNALCNLINGLNDKSNRLEKENKQLKEEIARQKYTKHIMRDNIKSYERAIKRLRKSYEEFDEMRLERIRFLEKRLKKNGLGIYVNGCGDVE